MPKNILFLAVRNFGIGEIGAEGIDTMNRVERISREAEHLAFEYQQLFNAGREPSDADVMLVRIANLLSELALCIMVSNTLRNFDSKKANAMDRGDSQPCEKFEDREKH